MLGKEDLRAIEQLMRIVVEENNEVLQAEMFGMKNELRTELKEDIANAKTELRDEFRTKMMELKRDIENIIDVKIEKSETFLLDEMDRYYQMTQKDIIRLENKVDRIEQYYSVKNHGDEERDLMLQVHQEAIDDIRGRLVTVHM